MAQQVITPTGREKPFEGERMIVSKTDLRGTITYVNRTFMEIADFPYTELIGKPHNVIRHPDMPRTAFRHLWKTIQAGEEWFGMVKNITANGDHYWVFANVTTDYKDGEAIGYYSIRRPLPASMKALAEELYATLCQVESTQGLEAGEQWLLAQVKAAGFESYRDFMLQTYLKHSTSAGGEA